MLNKNLKTKVILINYFIKIFALFCFLKVLKTQTDFPRLI